MMVSEDSLKKTKRVFKLITASAAFFILALNSLGSFMNNSRVQHVPHGSEYLDVYRNTVENIKSGHEKVTVSYNIEIMSNESVASLQECPRIPPNLLGRQNVSLEMTENNKTNKTFSRLMIGGRFHPKECKARHKVAIIVPYRDREAHLWVLLYTLHPILMRQQLDYGIYVVEQVDGISFNRALLMNIGFKEALKQNDYQCFIFHDVDLIPEDDRNLYQCPPKNEPRHMSVAIDKYKYKLDYNESAGGVLAMSKEQMIKVNGFSNEYWGWGGEDDDMYYRIKHNGFNITRYSEEIARYTMLKHVQSDPSPVARKQLSSRMERFEWDGLSNLKYELLDLRVGKLFTRLLVNITNANLTHN